MEHQIRLAVDRRRFEVLHSMEEGGEGTENDRSAEDNADSGRDDELYL